MAPSVTSRVFYHIAKYAKCTFGIRKFHNGPAVSQSIWHSYTVISAVGSVGAGLNTLKAQVHVHVS